MVRLRLRRVGAKKQPSYRVVAADKESPRDGRFIENLGFYNPRTEPATIELKEERIYDWMSKGAQMSDAAEKVFRSAGLLDRYERFKGGESVEVLIQEAKEAEAARNINPKTQRQAPAKAGKKTKTETQDEPAMAEAEKIDEAVEEPTQAEVEEEAAEVLEEQVESEQEEEAIIEDKPEDALDEKPADEPEPDDEAAAEPVEEREEENLDEEPPAEDADDEEPQEPEESEVEPGQSE
jgi:small subunit ribosomal protein S16